jgi:acetyltransferase
MAIIAVRPGDPAETMGVVRAVSDPDGAVAEFAILVRSDLAGRGLGRLLMDKIIRFCRNRGIGCIEGDVLSNNTRMLALARRVGFAIGAHDQGTCRLTMDLRGLEKAAATRGILGPV